MPNLQGSTPQGGGPTLRCFGAGRAVIIFPIAEEMGTAFGDAKEAKPFIRSNVVALPDPQSAPYITFGGEVMQDGVTVKVPDTHRVDLGPHGWMAENVKIGGGGMLYILRAALRSNSARVGRLYKDAQFNNAWKLTDPDKDEPALYAQALEWIKMWAAGAFQNVYPVPIQQVPQQMPAQQYAQPVAQAAPPAQQGWGQQAPQSAPPVQQGWGQQAPQQPAYAGPVQQQAPVPMPQYATTTYEQPHPGAQPIQPQQQAPQGWGAPQQVAPQQPQQGWGQPPAQAEQVPHPGF